MSRWFRCYDDLVDDPKVQRLPAELFKALINLWCLASKNGGALPPIEDIAFKLRMKVEKVDRIIASLHDDDLIDIDADGSRPHNWDARQFKSDVSNERVKRHRKHKRNVTQTVTATPPETEAETETKQKEPEADASAVPALRDVRADLFGKGLQSLASMTGKTPDSCRSLVGRWLKSVNDEAIHVLGAIEDAERNRVADPVAWINRALQPRQGPNGKRTVQQASADLLDRVRAFDEPAPRDLCDGTGEIDVRLLPSR